ncbi:MAG: amidase [Chloroflexi bacterium]|nr:amidase [Chloroflexota bacterium]
MNDLELMTLPGWKQRDMVVGGEISSRELVEASFRRIDAVDGQLHAFITLDKHGALEAADAADAAVAASSDPAGELGPFHGVPISIKDLELTKGLRTTLGCKVYEEWVPDYDSTVVERVRKSGAVIVGKTQTPEFGNAAESYNKVGEATNNPWNVERTAGGSSGGAAASVAAGMVSIATGTDGGGSVRIPCAWNGIFGIKATLGRIPRFGGVANPAPNQTSSSGPMTRYVKDTAIMTQALSGHEVRDTSSLRGPVPDFLSGLGDGVKGMKIGWSINLGLSPAEKDIEQTVYDSALAFKELGADVSEAPLELKVPPFSYWWDVWTGNQVAMYGDLVDSNREDLMPYTVAMNEAGRLLTAADYARALKNAEVLRSDLAAYFDEYDLLILPTTAISAYPHQSPPSVIAGQESETFAGISYGAIPTTMAFNISWNPAASMPVGFDGDGMPIGLQVVGNLQDEATVLRACAAFEQARPWAEKMPPVS